MNLKFAKDFQNGVLEKYAALGDDERIDERICINKVIDEVIKF
ncbi:MAG: hypothetical protein SPK65_08335 [Succinivibrio dextrinosolvens]|nr:hypothetical protein [Succinivibrio dextrinosolvens]MDY6466586.1 hypothetical protein [Succinivibrio dextrinosolvens]